jgi:hypothetical protein
MSFNRSATLQKLARRANSSQVARARRIVSQTPNGALARRLGLNGDQPAVNMARQEPIARSGRQVKSEMPASRGSDMVPMRNAERGFLRRTLPGSPFR